MAVRARLKAAAIRDEANAPHFQKDAGLLNVFSIPKYYHLVRGVSIREQAALHPHG
jgi:hypothetical protein